MAHALWNFPKVRKSIDLGINDQAPQISEFKYLPEGELMVVVEYCCHGNLQQFLLARRHRFLNQVNPLTGIYDPNIKPSVISGRRIGRSVSTVGGNEAYSNKLVNRPKMPYMNMPV